MNLKSGYVALMLQASLLWASVKASFDIMAGVDTAHEALNKLYAASVGEGSVEDVLKYNIQFTIARDLKLTYFHPQINEYGNEKVLLEPYRNLSVIDLVTMIEVVGVTHMDLLVYIQTGRKRYKRESNIQNKIMVEFFDDQRPSDSLKFGAACLYYGDMMDGDYLSSHGGAALWVCGYNGGEYVPTAVRSYLSGTSDKECSDESIEELSTSLLLGVLENVIKNYSIDMTNQFLDTLSPEFMNRLHLDVLYNQLEQADEGVKAAIASHTRRAYGFGEEIPDEWVLRAIY